MPTNKQKILEFIKAHHIAVVATTDTEKPEAAVVEYGETDELELIIDTFISSRKSKNILHNPNVALVIGWDNNITLQYEGEATELKGSELEKSKEIYFKKNPRAKEWDGREGIVYFKIIPKWIRYSDLNKHPWEVFEINL
ncbi:MAG: pyridoxamine 5'-phosphate oxidase family protein [Patescibacteria group bacterium]